VSQENVEIVRRYLESANGRDLVPELEEMVKLFGPESESSAILAHWADHPVWRHTHRDLEWFSDAPLLARTARGPQEIIRWWAEWVEVWERYVFTTVELRDLGDWVLNVADVHARGRQGIDVEMRVFELARVRDGKIAVYYAGFRSEHAALKAVGLEE
jgi:ketosteroid isomerase-like protein